ncbi:MAG: hypothetical protein AAFU71_05690 [Cyanobacteria bacterium J06632_22]
MKVSIGMKLRQGPWGGGNQFGNALVGFLERQGVEVYFDLSQPNLDLILLCEPRSTLQISAFSESDIFHYLNHVNAETLVIQRINECDERKGTQGINQRLKLANLAVDYTVFVASWLRDLFVDQGLPCQRTGVILNGSDPAIFHAQGYHSWDRQSPLKIVTHHWGGHWMKGFDVYSALDEKLAEQPWSHPVRFTYIGNVPEGFQFRHAQHIAPLHGAALADQLRQHHVYLTASLNEPGGHHQNEGASCGLPLLYRESGCMPEYCQGFGLSFTEDTFIEKLQAMMDGYESFVPKMKDYPHNAERTSRAYYQLFQTLLDEKGQIVSDRAKYRFWKWLALRPKPSPKALIKSWLRR